MFFLIYCAQPRNSAQQPEQLATKSLRHTIRRARYCLWRDVELFFSGWPARGRCRKIGASITLKQTVCLSCDWFWGRIFKGDFLENTNFIVSRLLARPVINDIPIKSMNTYRCAVPSRLSTNARMLLILLPQKIVYRISSILKKCRLSTHG